jgi:hypothetical protein
VHIVDRDPDPLQQMTTFDLRLILDLLLARLVWLAAAELVFKPLFTRLYRRADQALGDRLPDLP